MTRREFIKVVSALFGGGVAAIVASRISRGEESQVIKEYLPLILMHPYKVVWTIGDSIIRGFGGGLHDMRTYMYAADNRMKFIGTLTNNNFKHDGHDGYTTQQIVDNLPTWASMITEPPEHIFVHAGTADIELHSVTNMADIVNYLNYMYPYAHIHVARIIQYYVPTTRVTIFNQTYIDPLQGVHIIDMENLLTPVSDYYDKLHPNATGYQKMANSLLAAIA